MTGASESKFQSSGVFVSSQGLVLRTPAMVRDRLAAHRRKPGVLGLRQAGAGDLEGGKLVSLKKMAFPKLAEYSARYRLVYDFGKAGKPALVLMDMIMVGEGRSEISLFVSAPTPIGSPQTARVAASRDPAQPQ